MKKRLMQFFAVLAGTASVVGTIFIGSVLLLGQEWVDRNSTLLFTHGIYWLVIPALVWAVRVESSELSLKLPKVIKTLENGILLVKNSDWLGVGVGVSIFVEEDEYERLIGEGYVANVQLNKLVQIQVLGRDSDQELPPELSNAQNRLIIRPSQRTL